MIQVRISSDALDDLEDGFQFYELQEPGLGDYFISQLRADIDGLRITVSLVAGARAHRWAKNDRLTGGNYGIEYIPYGVRV